jgi:hypothetical protein
MNVKISIFYFQRSNGNVLHRGANYRTAILHNDDGEDNNKSK